MSRRRRARFSPAQRPRRLRGNHVARTRISPKTRNSALTHLTGRGEARMVDVSAKAASERVAVAEGCVVMRRATLDLILRGDGKKGDVLGTARIAGIMAAKRTHELIPLCHPLA